MKKITLLFAFVVLLAGCSKDDDNNVDPQLTNVEKLAAKSLWVLDRVEVTEILDAGGSSMSKEQFSSGLTEAYKGFAWEFSKDGSGSITAPDFLIFDFTYTILGTDTGQDNFTMEFDVPAIPRTVKTKVNAETFNYEWDVYSATEIPYTDAEVRAIFVFK